jgi:hypothetical protein
MHTLAHFAGRFFAVPVLLITCLFVFSSVAKAERPAGPLLIGEIAWAGSSKSTADEWLELWNLGDEPIDLTGYRLVGAGGSDGIIFDATHVIPPRSAFLVANYDAEKSAMAIDPQLVTSAVSLPNDKLKIELFDPDGVLVDMAGDGAAPSAGFSSSTKASMLRKPDGGWRSSDTQGRMDEGIADFGTPGICDGCAWSEADLAAAEVTETETMMTTSTEPFVEPTTSSTVSERETTSSTQSIPIVEVATTTVETAALTETSTTTETVPESVSVPTIETAPIQTRSVTVTTRTISYPAFRLHRISPAPPSGKKEWVEIKLPDGASLTDLDGYALYDASSRAALFPPSDMTLVSQIDRIVKIELTSAKLNNGGDTVELRRPDGSVVERMTYPKTGSGETWIKNPAQTAWVLEGAEEPVPTESQAEVVYATPPDTIELLAFEAQAEDAQELQETVSEPLSIPEPYEEEIPPHVELATIESLAAKKTTGAAAKKNVVYQVTHDMLTKIEPNIRIAISGTVATKAGIVNKNHYVLLSPDGHGLYVRGTSKQPTPPMGTVVRVTGTLTLNDDGLSLGVGTKDRWENVSTPIADPVTRPVNFLEPQLEDGWSLVEVQGTVRETKTTSALLDLGDALVNVTIKSASGYRASRLNEGDVVRVRGLLDPRGEEPAIVIRTTGDVEILSHGTLAAPKDAPKGLPLWMPFGAAGFTVAASEGYKRFKRFREKTRVEQLVAKAHAAD